MTAALQIEAAEKQIADARAKLDVDGSSTIPSKTAKTQKIRQSQQSY
ncbi:MAG: hypothetical protein ACLTCI_00185 [[Clostridium] nexile]